MEVMWLFCISRPGIVSQSFIPVPAVILTLPWWGERGRPFRELKPLILGQSRAEPSCPHIVLSSPTGEAKSITMLTLFTGSTQPNNSLDGRRCGQIRSWNEMALFELSSVVLSWAFKSSMEKELHTNYSCIFRSSDHWQNCKGEQTLKVSDDSLISTSVP